MPVFLQMRKNYILREISRSLNVGHSKIFHAPKWNTNVLWPTGFRLTVTVQNHWSRTNLRITKLQDVSQPCLERPSASYLNRPSDAEGAGGHLVR